MGAVYLVVGSLMMIRATNGCMQFFDFSFTQFIKAVLRRGSSKDHADMGDDEGV
jgi:hypothetical protein